MEQKQELKPLLAERMENLLGKDFQKFKEILRKEPPKSIRCNTLKMTPEELKKRLTKKSWKIKQPFKSNPEIMIVENEIAPGELGRSIEHLLGYYYVQDISSMLPIIALNPKPEETVLDLCAAPGSKTTQAAAKMENSGTLIANELSLGRVKILASNTERCGVTNMIITKKEGYLLCKKLKEKGFLFDKILIDAPCSGEGTLRSSKMTHKMWNIHTVKKLSGVQKNLLTSAIEILKPGGEIVYSTCTHSPEENEEVINLILRKFKDIKIEKLSLPSELKTNPGILGWKDKEYLEDVKYSCRIYPQDNDTEGFFIAKLKKEEAKEITR
ncbi:MAG: RsmB/NOP family class I SAM-dependent RNA methyltransferase [Candidatus Pacearchaeota archaeon]